MSTDTSNSSSTSDGDRANTISIIDVLLILARNRDRILKIVFGFALIGFIYSVAAPVEYTTSSKVIREVGEGGLGLPPSLSSLSGGFGIDLGGMRNEGLSPDAVPEILSSREVRLNVARDTISAPGSSQRMTLVEYVNRDPGVGSLILDYTVKLPITLYQLTKTEDAASDMVVQSDSSVIYMTEEEVRTLKWLAEQINSSIDAQNGIMSIYARAESPQLSVALMRSVINHLTSRVREIQTVKTRRNLVYIRDRFEEAEQELRKQENRLASFLESNKGRTTPTLRFQENRFQRQVRFAEQIYSNLQEQLTRAKLTLERQKPVLTIVEAPSLPNRPTSPRRALIVVLSLILGGIAGVSIVVFEALFKAMEANQKEDKIKEIKSAFHPQSIWKEAKRSLFNR